MAVRRLAAEQPEAFAFSNDNEEWAKGQIGKFPEGRQQSAVIPLLWRAQEQHDGWLPEPAIRYVADMLGMPYIRALEVATFYTMFNLAPVGKHFVQLCGTTPCMLRGSDEIREVCKRVIGPESTVSTDGMLSWLEVECLGACVNAPMVQINKDYYEDLTPDGFEDLLLKLKRGEDVRPGPQSDRTTSYPLGGATTLTDEAAITRTPPHEDGPVDPATEPVAKAQPKSADERLEAQVDSASGEVADDIKQRRDGTQALDPADTATSDVVARTPQGEDRSGDAVAREKSSIESSTFAKSENAPVGGGAPGATTGDADEERRADARRPDPGKNARVGQEAATGLEGTEAAGAPIPSTASGQTTAPQVGEAPTTGGDTTVGINDDDGALPKETPTGSVMSAAEGVRKDTAAATDPANPSLGAAAKTEQSLDQAKAETLFETTDKPASGVATASVKLGSKTTAEEAKALRAAARADDRAPLVLEAARGEADDLKRVSGIGPKLEGLLNSLGFFHFGQLAVWTDENVQWVDDHLEGFNGRISRDDWVGQAKTLAAGDTTDFSKRYDDGETGQTPDGVKD